MSQLLAIAQRLRNWKIDLEDTADTGGLKRPRVLSTERRPLVHDNWMGTSIFETYHYCWYDMERNAWTDGPGVVRPVAPLVYHTVILKWTAVVKA